MHNLEIIAGIVFSVIVIAALSSRSTVNPTEEKGPMPKNHGGFGQTVHGGKS